MSTASKISSLKPNAKTTYPIVLGKSFFQREDGDRPTGFITARYRFKPSSVDQSQTGNISFNASKASLEFSSTNQHNNNKSVFVGQTNLASSHEYFMWFDARSQQMVLERGGINIKALKHDRNGFKKNKDGMRYVDNSKDRLKLMEQRNKKKKKQKNKSTKIKSINDKSTKKSSSPNNNNMNNNNNDRKRRKLNDHSHTSSSNNSDTSSTRSSSLSLSPPQSLRNRAIKHKNKLTATNTAQYRTNINHPPSNNMNMNTMNRNTMNTNTMNRNNNNNNQHRMKKMNMNRNNKPNNNNNWTQNLAPKQSSGPQPLFCFDDDDDSDDEDEDL